MNTQQNPDTLDAIRVIRTMFGGQQPSRLLRFKRAFTEVVGMIVSIIFATCFCAAAIIGVIALAGWAL